MATFDQPSMYRLRPRPIGSDPQISVIPVSDEKDRPVRSLPQGAEDGNIFYFIEPRPRNPWAAIASLSFLSLVVLGLLAIPFLKIEPLPKRETFTLLYLQPPPAAGANVGKLEAPTPVPSFTAPRTASLTPVRKMEEAAPTPAGISGGVIGGVPGGSIGAIPAGVFTGITAAPSVPVAAKTPEPAPAKRMRIAARVAEANLVHDVPPQYPSEAGRARIEGTVVLMALIGADGTVKDVRVESGLPILAQAAIDAVKQWRYKPYLIDGQPVEVDSRITINFTLSAS